MTIGDVMDCAVERGWLLVDSEDIKICLTDEGRRMVRAGIVIAIGRCRRARALRW
jgi:hypothetical protein